MFLNLDFKYHSSLQLFMKLFNRWYAINQYISLEFNLFMLMPKQDLIFIKPLQNQKMPQAT